MPIPIQKIRVKGNLAFIPLTHGLEAMIDASDVPLVDRWNWFAIDGEAGPCAIRVFGGLSLHRLERVIMDVPPASKVYFVTDNHLDCRSVNLMKAKPKRISGHPAVRWVDKEDGWGLYYSIGAKTSRFGIFKTVEEAVAKFNKMNSQLGRT